MNGGNDLKNLQILCKKHNLYKAKVEYGEGYIDAKIKKSG